MSVDLTFWRRNDNFLVRIQRDGAIEFLDHDIEYDLAMVEFGEPETYAIEIKRQWETDPHWFFVRNFETTQEHLLHLAIDFCEHAMMQLKPPFSKHPLLINAISLLRRFTKGTIDESDMFNIDNEIQKASHEIQNNNVKKVIDAIHYTILAAGTVLFYFERVALRTKNSRGSHAEKEKKWQIRRFVDCMASVQAGKPWPPLEATK